MCDRSAGGKQKIRKRFIELKNQAARLGIYRPDFVKHLELIQTGQRSIFVGVVDE
jgi:hypothetical protein